MGFYPVLPQTLPLSGGTLTGVLNSAGIVNTGTVSSSGIISQNAGTNSAGSAPLLTPANANGTAAQLTDTTRDYMLYLTIGTAGTALTVAIGPTAGVADTIYTAATATGGEAICFRLPAGWFWKWAATTATLAEQTAIGC
jgi:hypothetical protein